MQKILEAIANAGGDPIFVGGCIRDEILNIPCKDTDIEVFGLSAQQLIQILSNFGKVSVVGESFGVIKLRIGDEEFDFTLPRRDNKIGRGHKAFEIEFDHTMTPLEAAKRRDFTINAIGKRSNGEFVDPFNGQEDIHNKILRHVSEHFAEDPLRVLRGFQFAARFEMTVCDETVVLCNSLKNEFDTLAKERIWGEWFKWATKSKNPSLGLEFLKKTDWISLFPKLADIIDVPQDSTWHPEGEVFSHTCHVVNEAQRIIERECINDEEDKAVIILAALCHDFGKAITTVKNEKGRWTAPNHAFEGVPLARNFLEQIGCLERIIERVLPLVQEHMVHLGATISEKMVRRLSVRLGKATIRELLFIIEADHSGRPPLPRELPESAREIQKIAQELALEDVEQKPLIMGRHLMELGMEPSPIFGVITKQAFESQLDGHFSTLEEGLEWVKKTYFTT